MSAAIELVHLWRRHGEAGRNSAVGGRVGGVAREPTPGPAAARILAQLLRPSTTTAPRPGPDLVPLHHGVEDQVEAVRPAELERRRQARQAAHVAQPGVSTKKGSEEGRRRCGAPYFSAAARRPPEVVPPTTSAPADKHGAGAVKVFKLHFAGGSAALSGAAENLSKFGRPFGQPPHQRLCGRCFLHVHVVAQVTGCLDV